MFAKMDPERYKDRDAFMRRYGADTVGSKDALRREMARYMYPSKIDPDIKVDKKSVPTELSEGQNMALKEMDKHLSAMYLANMEGKTDVGAARAVSPASFEGEPEENHEKIAKDLQRNTGILKSSAVQRIIYNHADNPAIENLATMAKERKGKPGLVFAHSLAAVKAIGERLTKEGHKVITITGGDTGQQKEAKRAAYQNGEADILVASDAAAVGMNVQRGQWCYQHDTPQTAMVHAQRQGRINRIGQQNDVELLDNVPNHPEIHRARDRLTKKYALRDLMTTPMEGLDETGVAYYLKQRDALKAQKDAA
jgi:ERCC4-related helicase